MSGIDWADSKELHVAESLRTATHVPPNREPTITSKIEFEAAWCDSVQYFFGNML